VALSLLIFPFLLWNQSLRQDVRHTMAHSSTLEAPSVFLMRVAPRSAAQAAHSQRPNLLSVANGSYSPTFSRRASAVSRRPCTAVSIGRKRSGCASAVPTCYSRFRKGRAECTGERTCGFGRATLLHHKKSSYIEMAKPFEAPPPPCGTLTYPPFLFMTFRRRGVDQPRCHQQCFSGNSTVSLGRY
jgi:hypothetical protein